jgi:small conductance mechanosensitive channel
MKYLIPSLCVLVSLAMPPAFAQEAQQPSTAIPPALQEDLKRDHSLMEIQLLTAPLTLDQLTAEAEEWQGFVQESMTRIASLKVAALSAEGEALVRIHEQINEASTERTKLTDKFGIIVDSMELKGGDPDIVAGYRKYISGALTAELQATDFKTMFSSALDWGVSKEGGIGFLIKAASIIGALFALIIVARLVRGVAARGVRRIGHLSQLMQDFLLKATFWLTFAIGLMIALSLFGVNITPLFAVLGGASFILAFAMQETLGNLASGLMIMINKPFDVGDLVDTNGILGEVQAVSTVSTTVRTLDNQVVILPNSAVWGSIITNVTVSPVRRVDMVFGIGYSDELGDSSVNFICRPWARTEDYWTVYWDLTRQVKERFDAAGVSIPFPQRDVHLYQAG